MIQRGLGWIWGMPEGCLWLKERWRRVGGSWLLGGRLMWRWRRSRLGATTADRSAGVHSGREKEGVLGNEICTARI